MICTGYMFHVLSHVVVAAVYAVVPQLYTTDNVILSWRFAWNASRFFDISIGTAVVEEVQIRSECTLFERSTASRR